MADAPKNFLLNINLKKTEVLYHPPPREAYSPTHISIDSTSLNAVEHFPSLIALFPAISQSARILTTACPMPTIPLEDRQREYGRVIRSASPRRSRYTEPSWSRLSCTVQRPGFSTGSTSGYWSGFTDGYCTPSLASNEEVLKRASLPSTESILFQARLRWSGRVSRMEDIRMPKAVFLSELREGKRDRGAKRKRYRDHWRDSLHRQESAISHGSRRPQTEAVGAHQWEKPVVSSRQRGMKPEKKKTQEAERSCSIPVILSPNLRLSKVQ